MTPSATSSQTSQNVSVRPSSNISITTATPDAIKAILLSDGWHEVEDCEQTHFAVSEGMSEPQPNQLYSALSYLDKKSGKRVISSLSSVQGFEFEEVYSNQQSS